MQVIPVVFQQTLWFCIPRFGLSGSCLALQWEVKMSQRKAVYAAKFLRLGWSHGTWVQTCGKHMNLWTSVNLFPQFQGASKSPCRWCFLDAPFIGAKPIQNHYTHFHILHCNTQRTEEGRNMLNIYLNMKEWSGRFGGTWRKCERTWKVEATELDQTALAEGETPGPHRCHGGRGFQQIGWSKDEKCSGLDVVTAFFWIVLFRPLKSNLGYILSRFSRGLLFSRIFPLFCHFAIWQAPSKTPCAAG